MTRHYTTKLFFRRVPNALLQRFFHEQDRLLDIKISELKETKIDLLFDAWLALPEDWRNKTEGDFRNIWALGCEKGFNAIKDAAKTYWAGQEETLASFVSQMASLKGHYHRAMITYLDYQEIWSNATTFYYADALPYWRKSNITGAKVAQTDQASIDDLEQQLSCYFHTKEGRGKNCRVEVLQRHQLTYFIAFPEDYAHQSLEWVNDEFENCQRNPAFQVFFVYSECDASLDINFRGPKKTIKELRKIFAKSILKIDDVPDEVKGKQMYDLEPLRDKQFEFEYDCDSQIEDVHISKLQFTSIYPSKGRVLIEEADGKIYHAIDRFDLRDYKVTMAEIKSLIKVDPTKRAKKVTIKIYQNANACSLKYEGYELKLRKMLSDSGIELVTHTELLEELDHE